MMKFKDMLRFAFQLKPIGVGLPGMAFLPVSATFLALAYFAYVLCFVVASGTADAGQAPILATPVAVEPAVNSNPPPDLLQIAGWHLFGQSPDAGQADTAVSETRLRLKLLGVFLLSQSPETACAVIQTDDGQQNKYRPGDELPGGAILKTVEPGRVVVEHGHRQEFLALERNSTGLPPATE